ncbi:MAG: Flp pilus assembly protein CpaB [Chloroflexota bacterium]
MRRGGLLVILGLLLMIAAVAGFLLLSRASNSAEQPKQPEVPQRQVLVALQDIPRGTIIGQDMVGMQSYPADTLQDVEADLILSPELAVGKIARTDIARRQPLLAGMLLEPAKGRIGGSDAALLLPEGSVAMAFRVDQLSSIAYALQPGDHVDVLISLWLADLDPDFQSKLPNKMIVTNPDGSTAEMILGRAENGPGGGQVVAIPSEGQRSRLVTQLTLQNLLVLGVGNWTDEQETEPVPTPTPGSRQPNQVTTAPGLPNVITLALSQQDALVLKYAQEASASITLVLRRNGDEGQVSTTSVTLQYLMDRFGIEVPPKLPFGMESGGARPGSAPTP